MTRVSRTVRSIAGVAAVLAVAAAVAAASTGPGGPPEQSVVNRIDALVSSPEFDGEYGGDVLHGDRIDVYGTASGIPAMRDAISARLGAAAIDATTFITVEHPFSELAGLTRRIADDGDALAAEGVDLVAWGPDAESNTVRVSVRGSTATAEQVLGDRYGRDLISVVAWEGPLPVRAGGGGFGVDIQATLTRRGDPDLGANFRPDGDLATARWSICPPPDTTACTPTRHRRALRPGRTRAGTVFLATATYRGHAYTARTRPWRGTVHAMRRPSLGGRAVVGGTVRPIGGGWRGGWPGDFSFLRVEACRTADARRCVTMMDTDPMHPGPHRRVVVPRRYAGWYLFAFDQRLARDTAFAEPAFGRPADLPPLRTSPTVVRSATGLRVSG